LCEALQALGPGFIKFGQALATRADLIGPELAGGLVQLQDRLPPFSGKRAIKIIEDSSQRPLPELFTSFDEEAIAAASIAQVHKARLADGRVVAVKILRPGIAKLMRRDVRFFRAMARLTEAVAPGLRRLKLVTAVQQFEQISDIELDLRMEAAAGTRLQENMANDKGIRIPHIDLERTNSHMLVIEWIEGIRIDDVEALQAAGHDIAKITEAAATSFFNQVFRDGYFHADMHPGNIFVTADGLLVPIDFGIMGQLDFADRLFLARLLDAILKRNYDEVARLHYDAGMLDDSVSLAAFSQSLRAVADPVLGKALGDISLGLVLGQILQISARFDISVQPQFNLLQKTMMMAEGVARSLNPSADMWAFARPLASDWISSEDNIRAQIDRVLSDFRQLYLKLPQILEKLDIAPPPPPPAPKWPYLIAAISVLIALYSTLPVH
jgi:ubiquinone biosynthesis protein